MCVSFYVSVMWDHVVDSYSPGLYDVNVSLNYFVHRRKLGSLLVVPCLGKKKKNLTHSFQMLSMQMFGRDENTPNVKKKIENHLFLWESLGNRRCALDPE